MWSTTAKMSGEGWLNDPVFRPFYHRTGYVMSASSDRAYEAVLEDVRGREHFFEKVDTPEQFRATMPRGVLQGEFKGWRGFWKKDGAGWVFARGALVAAFEEATNLGVTFITGKKAGAVQSLVFSGSNKVKGAVTTDGKEHIADVTILAAGAGADQLLDFKKQLRPTAWTLAHIPLDNEKKKLFENLPVLFNIEKGFFMEPDGERHELKVCDEHPGYCNFETVNGELRSIPFRKEQIPIEAEERARDFLRECVPQLAERPFSFARICWDADTPNRQFLIDHHPDHEGLLLAVGGSGHSFKTIPIIGKIVVDRLEGKLDERFRRVMRWRPETAVDRDWWDTQDRYGADNKVMEFKEVKGWTSIPKR